MRVLTIAGWGSMPRARALGRSLRRHQPGWSYEVLLLGREEACAAWGAPEDGITVRSVCEELDLDIEALLALHDEHDLTVLLLPALLARYSSRSPEPVLHLPCSAWVLGDLAPVEDCLSHPVMLVPRAVHDVPSDGLEPSLARLEDAGRVDPTIMAVRGGAHAERFLSWWGARVEQMLGSIDARHSGARPEDRPWLGRYLELAPARFLTAMLEDPGCDRSEWNMHEQTLKSEGGYPVLDGRWPLRFVNLPGFDPDRPHRLSPTASRVRVSRSEVLHELCETYAAELRECGWRDPDRRGQVGRRIDHELIYDDSLRSIYLSALALGEEFGDIFKADGANAFIAWLQGPAARGGAHGVNRYLYHRVAHERPDVVRAYPDLDGADGAGYVEWCWAFGRSELGIPERFMPPATPAPHVHAAAADTADAGRSPQASSHRHREATGPPAAAGDQLAVRLTGYLGHTLGLGAAARGYARALDAAAVPVSTVSVPLHHLALPGELAAEYGLHGFEDLVHDGAHGFEIVAVNADELPDLVERLGDGYFAGPRIGIWGWETNTIPLRWARAFALVDEIWVYSRFMAENIGAVAPVPVIALPPPVERPAEPAGPLRLGVPGGFLFLFVFDYLSTVQRKNPVGLIEAFKRAFAPGEGPQLLIKTINAPLRPLAEEEVLWATHGRPDIHVVDRSLTGPEMDGLMAACDCYVSLHRSEGFGLTMAEAMALGKPVIGTGYSGNVDFMNSENSYLVDYSIGRVGAECEIYPPEGEWAEPSVEHAAELMRRVYIDPHEAGRLGERAAQDIARTLSPHATGDAMRRRLQELAAQHAAGGPVRGQVEAGSASAGAPPGASTSSHS